MKVQDIEIPYPEDRHGWYRFFEILPGLLSLLIFLTPIILSIFYVTAAALFIIVYVLIVLIRATAMSIRVIEGYGNVKKARKVDWEALLKDFYEPGDVAARYAHAKNSLLRGHVNNMRRLSKNNLIDMLPDEVFHVVVIATYNESQAIIHPTIEHVISTSGFADRKTILFIAYEERASEDKKRETLETLALYKDKFYHAEAVEHTLFAKEIPGKGANATHTGRRVAEWAKQQGIDPSRVMITVLDADNRPDKNFFSMLTYVYLSADNRKQKSYQPIALYNNNIWDVPAIMRICAISNTYFHTANSMRPHALRNFSAHSQSLDALIDTDFWSVRTIVEDGHQFWRSYFRYDGDYEVLPLYTPIYQDAVYAGGTLRTTKAQFKQIRRWTYGASDVAYVATRGFFMKSKVSKWDALTKFGRLLESHVGWATSAPLLLLAGWIPLYINRNAGHNIVAQGLPHIVSTINTVALIAILFVVYIGIATLPQRPPHHRKNRIFGFVWQWILTPVVGVVFNSAAAINSQAHLAFRHYIGTFDVTEKAVVNKDKK
jgi:cellulose synthase/poly-beta-1,6-N-acetylglucosamine synthase-like glycosyltransferase